MAIDIDQLVKSRIKPALIIDPSVEDDIPGEIEAQVALQGWTPEALTEPQKVYVAALTLEGLMPRLLLTYPEEAQEVSEGPERIRLPSRDQFMRLLQAAISALKATATKVITGEDEAGDKAPSAPPLAGVRSI